MSDWTDVALQSEFTAGSWRVVDVDGAQVAVFNLDGAYYAIEDICTHDGGILTGGTREGEEIICPRHGARFSIKTPSLDTPLKNLSGGNIQKLILARELSRRPRVLIAAQPTRGVDIGATEYIHERLLEQRDAGTAILLISEDLDEIQELSDQIAVIYEGRIVGTAARGSASPEMLGLLMAGVVPDDAPPVVQMN